MQAQGDVISASTFYNEATPSRMSVKTCPRFKAVIAGAISSASSGSGARQLLRNRPTTCSGYEVRKCHGC